VRSPPALAGGLRIVVLLLGAALTSHPAQVGAGIGQHAVHHPICGDYDHEGGRTGWTCRQAVNSSRRDRNRREPLGATLGRNASHAAEADMPDDDPWCHPSGR